MIEFHVTEHDQKRISEFKNAQGESYCGAIGGQYTYSFTPTSLGVVFTVTNNVTNATLDLTEYDKW